MFLIHIWLKVLFVCNHISVNSAELPNFTHFLELNTMQTFKITKKLNFGVFPII